MRWGRIDSPLFMGKQAGVGVRTVGHNLCEGRCVALPTFSLSDLSLPRTHLNLKEETLCTLYIWERTGEN